jgi:hypothetical protein
MRMRRASLTCAALAVSLTGGALGCSSDPPTPPVIHIEQKTANVFCIWICGYTAAGAAAGDFCVCALNQLGPIQSVDNVLFFQPSMAGTMADPCNPGGSLEPFTQWEYIPNPVTGAAFQAFAGGGNWSGFFSQTLGSIPPGGRPLTIKFEVTLAPSSSSTDLAEAITQNVLRGSAPFVGTGKGNPDGSIMFNPMHPPAVEPASMVFIIGSEAIPTLGEWGLIATAGGLLTFGWFAIRRGMFA